MLGVHIRYLQKQLGSKYVIQTPGSEYKMALQMVFSGVIW